MSPIGTFKIISPLLGNPVYTSTFDFEESISIIKTTPNAQAALKSA